jgi:DNA-binding GntR family transcriptional regulator
MEEMNTAKIALRRAPGRTQRPSAAGQGKPSLLQLEAKQLLIKLDELELSAHERLADRALRLLEEQIVTLQLAPGTVWSETALSKRIKIGRTPVREAVQRLAADHLVVIMRRHGIMISQINVQEQLLVLEARRQLEGYIASRSARRGAAEEKARLSAIAEAMETIGKAGDVFSFLRYYYFSKKLLCEAARNPYAARAIAPLHTLSRRFYFLHHEEFGDLPIVAEHHAAQARAAAIGDEEAVMKASERIVDYAEAFTKRVVTGKM